MLKKNILLLFLALLILWNSTTLINNENFLIRKTATNQIGRNIIQQTYEHENYTKISGYDDNLTNLEEFQHYTNPRDADTDDDFLTDEEEVNTYFTDSRKQDTDGDGWMDSLEIYYGTNPLDPLDYPDFETTPPFTESPPTNPYSGELKYYYLVIAAGSIVIVASVVYLIIRFRGRRSLI